MYSSMTLCWQKIIIDIDRHTVYTLYNLFRPSLDHFRCNYEPAGTRRRFLRRFLRRYPNVFRTGFRFSSLCQPIARTLAAENFPYRKMSQILRQVFRATFLKKILGAKSKDKNFFTVDLTYFTLEFSSCFSCLEIIPTPILKIWKTTEKQIWNYPRDSLMHGIWASWKYFI